MTRKSTLTVVLGSIVAFGLVLFILFTPQGVHFYGEVLFADRDTEAHEPTDYPTLIGEAKIARTLPLPAAIAQPSGIDYDEANDRFLVVTDQAEIFEVSADFRTVISSKVMSAQPLFFRQGTIESADYSEGQLYVSGDSGELQTWSREDNGWSRTKTVAAPSDLGAEGMAVHPDTGRIYVGEDDAIHVLDKDGKFSKTLKLEAETKPGRSLSEYSIAGLDFHGETLYAVTEYHSAILAIDPDSGAIEDSWALHGITEGAGLVVTDDTFYVVVDHELTEPRPGVKAYPR